MKILNITFKLFWGGNYSTYVAAHTNRSFDSMSSILLWMVATVEKEYPDFELKNKKVAEIDSGKFLSHALGLKVLGASNVFSFDLFKQFNQKEAFLSFSQQIMAKKFYSYYVNPDHYIETMDTLKTTQLDLNSLKEQGIEYLAPFDFCEYQENNYFNFIMSYTVLEHIPPADIEVLLEKTIDTLEIGGHFCHYIDLEDHKNHENAPFDFLIEENWTNRNCFSRGNRLRLSDWTMIFNKFKNIEYTFSSVLRRNSNLLPMDISKMSNSEIDNIRTSGILVIGKKC